MTAHRKRRGSKALRQQRPDNTQHGATALCPSNENKEDAGEGERYLIYFQPFGVTSSGKPSLISPDGVILFSWFSIGCAHILPLFPLHCEFGSFPCPQLGEFLKDKNYVVADAMVTAPGPLSLEITTQFHSPQTCSRLLLSVPVGSSPQKQPAPVEE